MYQPTRSLLFAAFVAAAPMAAMVSVIGCADRSKDEKQLAASLEELKNRSGYSFPLGSVVLEAGHEPGDGYSYWVVHSPNAFSPATRERIRMTIPGNETHETIRRILKRSIGDLMKTEQDVSEFETEEAMYRMSAIETDKGYYMEVEEFLKKKR